MPSELGPDLPPRKPTTSAKTLREEPTLPTAEGSPPELELPTQTVAGVLPTAPEAVSSTLPPVAESTPVSDDTSQRLQLATAAAALGTWDFEPATGQLVWDARCRELFDCAPQTEVDYNYFLDRLHPDDRRHVDRLVQSVLAGQNGGEFEVEYRVLRQAGNGFRWIRATGRAIFAPASAQMFAVETALPIAPQALRFIGTVQDITQRKQDEEVVRGLLSISGRLNSTLELNSLLDVLVDESMRMVEAESGVAGLFTPEGMVCHTYHHKGVILPFDYCWPSGQGLPGWIIQHKQSYLTNDVAQDAQIGPEIREKFDILSALSTPIISSQGDLLGFFELHNSHKPLGFTTTDQEHLVAVSQTAAIAIQNALAYRNLQRAEAELKEVDRRKDEFLATLAHELRNPLAPLRNGLQLLKIADEDRQLRVEAQLIMERQLSQMVRLIDDLLDVSRISLGRIELRKERVALSRVLLQAFETIRPLIQERQHHLELPEFEQPIFVTADLTRMTQVFANLLNNAAKYTDAGGHIKVTAAIDGDFVKVTVRDNGIGIPANMLKRIFEMFTQVKRSLELNEGGLGIGLTLVQRLVQMHGGDVEALSDGEGFGSAFVVRLPLADHDDTKEGMKMRELIDQATGKMRILVVDDNRDAANSLARLLSLLGHETSTAYDGLEALETAEKFSPEIVLLDIGMPKLSGYEVCRRLRELKPNATGRRVGIIALTGWGQVSDRKNSEAAGFDDHLVKPVDLATLQGVLRRLSGPREGAA